MSERRILFLHPTYDCSMDKVCRDDCYLLAGKSEEEKRVRLPDEYWVGVLRLAIEYGFEELSLPINPLRGITGVKDPLYWLRLLAPIAKEANMVVNVTTTAEVASKFTEEDGLVTDIIALSLDSFRAGKSWDRTEKKFSKVINHLRAMDVEVNCNLSFNEEMINAVLDGGPLYTLLNSFDYFTPLWPKMNDDQAWNDFNTSLSRATAAKLRREEGGYWSSEEQRALLERMFSPIWDGDKLIPDYCYSFARDELQCTAGHGMLSINADGKLAICAYNDYYADVSTLEKFEWYLAKVVPKAKNITYCELIRPANASVHRWMSPSRLIRFGGPSRRRRQKNQKINNAAFHNLGVLNQMVSRTDYTERLAKLVQEIDSEAMYNINRPQDIRRIMQWTVPFAPVGLEKERISHIPLISTRWDGRLPSRYMKKMYNVFPELKHYEFYHSTELLRKTAMGPKTQITYRLGVRIMKRYLSKIEEIRKEGYGPYNEDFGLADNTLVYYEANKKTILLVEEIETLLSHKHVRTDINFAVMVMERYLGENDDSLWATYKSANPNYTRWK